MNNDLGAIDKKVKCPEKISAQAPIWKDIAFNLIPVLLLGIVLRSLSIGAGAGVLTANIIFVLVTAAFTIFCVLITRSWKKRYTEMLLVFHKNGLSGTCPVNAFKSKTFEIPFSELKAVSAAKNRLTLRTASEKCVFIAEDAEELASELKKHIN